MKTTILNWKPRNTRGAVDKTSAPILLLECGSDNEGRMLYEMRQDDGVPALTLAQWRALALELVRLEDGSG